jgi:alpha-glucosidase (family GH31 glycosyl hydrolase)
MWLLSPSPELFAVEEEFMVGSAILVKPVVAPGVNSVDVALPAGARWYDAMTGAAVNTRSRTQRVQVGPGAFRSSGQPWLATPW